MSLTGALSASDRLGVDLARSENHLIRELIAARHRRGLKPAEVARRMGVDRSVVARFESGGTNPTMATVNRYAEAVGAMIRYTVEPNVVHAGTASASAASTSATGK